MKDDDSLERDNVNKKFIPTICDELILPKVGLSLLVLVK